MFIHFRSLRIKVRLAACLIASLAVLTAEQEAGGQDLTSYDAALERLLAAPSDPEASFDFAQAAIAASDPRAAIAALERILIFDPKLANIRLELGSLYLLVGAISHNPMLSHI